MQTELRPTPALIERAIELARTLQSRAVALQTRAERRQGNQLDRLLRSPADKAALTRMTDQAFRAGTAARTVDQFTHLLDSRGVPRFFGPLERAGLELFRRLGKWAPRIAVPLVKAAMRREATRVILPAERERLAAHLCSRQEAGVRMNVNFLGEALLGEDEARRRQERYLEALRLPEIEVLSVKISTLYSQISPLAREHTIAVLSERLEPIYREAARLRFTRPDGSAVPKFLYLDMEEYRDMSLTAEAFMRTLDRLESASAGIALQAYLPDSIRTQRAITEWAKRRVASGGAPVVIRLVKGANLEMERVEASLRGWPQAPFRSKRETDASYKRMLHFALQPENLAAVRIGVASHNVFEVAYALALAGALDAGDRVQFEMLEGMAGPQRRALGEQARDLLLYAPACRREEFVHAIGYLVRRLDENTAPENFLRHAFRLQVGSEEWTRLETDFRESFETEISDAPRRTQDRCAGTARCAPSNAAHRAGFAAGDSRGNDASLAPLNVAQSAAFQGGFAAAFANEPDTDFSLPQHGRWAEEIVARWITRCGSDAAEIPLVVDGEEIFDGRRVRECRDPSRPGVCVGRYREASDRGVDRAIDCARCDEDEWCGRSVADRTTLLARAAEELRAARGDLIGAALANGGKTIAEADPEVSEAIDFAEFYAESARYFFELPSVRARPAGVAVVVPPWNFPIAIPCGGIAAALAAGNTVILKPASPAVLVAWEICRCFWRAGISQRTLQFLPCPGDGAGARLAAHAGVNAVLLTGGTATALEMLRAKPALRLCAETGGKNATIVTALSDREQAIRHAVHSAFSHSGQKCSATSLLLLEAEVYDDPRFREMLVDAAASLRVGPAWELHTRVGPLIREPRGELERGLTTLEPGESWALPPRRDGANPQLWSPGIKYGVQPGGFTHRTELFGPVLGVMRFTRFDEAIALANATGYGLTSGLESLDEREQEQWKRGIRAGNLYLNKPTVGAIVLRQPFGGMGKSSVGPGMKAGGPNYVAQVMGFEDRPQRRGCVEAEAASECAFRTSYERAWREEFSREHDHFRLLGEDNVRRYVPIEKIRIRVSVEDSPFEISARVCAAQIVGSAIVISATGALNSDAAALLEHLADSRPALTVIRESDEALAGAIRAGEAGRVRYAGPDRVPPIVRAAAAEIGAYVADRPVLAEGRIELLWYLREQSISAAYHRYGNLGARAGELRAEPA